MTLSNNKINNLNIDQYLEEQDKKQQLRFITCGSVDDGKSTLLGRILYDSKTIFEDQLSATEIESQKYGTQGKDVDLALLVDGLQAEREQGITIDVAYRFFETEKRKFIAADTPGHEEYTRNMATGASTADLAVILVDARKGLLDQTRRHTYIVSLLGIKNVILAVNKMDLVANKQSVFDDIVNSYYEFIKPLDLTVKTIPLSALVGDNVFYKAKKRMSWYTGKTLMEYLETIEIGNVDNSKPFRLPVQWVNRPNSDFRGFSGLIASGTVEVGSFIRAVSSGQKSTVKTIISGHGEVQQATKGQSITLVLNDEIDVSRGELITSETDLINYSNQLSAHIIWMSQEAMLPERRYLIHFSTSTTVAQVIDLVHRVNINNLDKIAVKRLELNEVGYCKIKIDQKTAFDSYKDIKDTGSFILIDQYTNATIGAGVISHSLSRSENIKWHSMKIDKQLRCQKSNQKPCVIWFTGLSGSGKSTLADLLEKALFDKGKQTYLLDGDNVRCGLNKDLGFTDSDRVENIRRVAEVSKLMSDAAIITIVSFISPFENERNSARDIIGKNEFVEVFVDTPIEICEQRDPKGLYKKARQGKLNNFTGISSKYETPSNPDIQLKTEEYSAEILVIQILDFLKEKFI